MTHDVFISFRGTDIRKGLLSHLKKELRRSQIDTYVDDERLGKGDEISPSLLRAIEISQILLVIFSPDYASSKWCLEELAKIIECMKRNQQIVLPVFFNVDPSHVRRQYGDSLAELGKTEDKLKVKRWRSALEKAGHLAGYHYPNNFKDEAHLVDKITEDILEKLSKFWSSECECDGLVGIDQNIKQIQSLLKMESSEVLVGVWGMGGIGKTTIARAFYDQYCCQYEGCCFLNVKENLENQGLNLLRERLMYELMEGGDLQYSSGANKAKFYKSALKRMGQKKVLVVLDDVDASEQIKYLVGKPICFGAGSRVIITSRYKHVLTSGGVGQIYEVKLMYPEDSLKLFCLNAFDANQPKKGYEKLSKEVVKIAGGNPLALTVLGADFHSKRTIEAWECALSKIKKYPIQKIQSVLRYSYDELHDVEREAFLDIAFFYKEEDKDYVIRELDVSGFHGTSSIDILQQKALITISKDNRIHMHELIGEMGLEIVRQESTKYPEGRSRLKDREDVNKVLSKMRETDKVEAIEIDSSQIATLSSQADILKNMSNLRLLKINYPLLTELSMPPSHVQRLLQDAIDSKRGDLKRSHMLEELPQFSMAKNLECANLTSCHSSHDLVNLECESLCEAHAPMFSLHNQVASLLSECKEVVSLASEIHIKCLYYLYIDGYSCPEEFSFTSKEERQLNITHSGMEILNSSIGYLSNLEGSDVDKNVPNELLCLRASYYVKLSKRMKRDNGIEKPKLRILFDGLRFSQRISFHELYYSAAIPQNISAFSRCHVLRMEASEVRRLQEVFPDEIKDDNNRIVHIIQILDMGRTLQAWYITTRGGMDFDKYSYSYTILKVAPKLAFCKRIL